MGSRRDAAAMSPKVLRQLGREIYGHDAWMRQLAAALGVHQTTVWRWQSGQQPVPKAAQLAIELLRQR